MQPNTPIRQKNAVVERFLTTLEPIVTVVKAVLQPDDHVVMLAHDGQYSVCRVHPARRLVTAPNYHVPSEEGLLSTTLSKAGLKHLLHWTDRETALSRFTRLAHPESNPRDGVVIDLLSRNRGSP